jgi:catechol 2,3-dioxygenase-like lactoylglutathione lyase family enzyme
MGVMRLGFVHLRVTDLEEARNHYSNTLGMQVVAEQAGKLHLKCWDEWDHHSLVLEEGGVGLVKLGYKCQTPEDLAKFERRSQQFGATTSRVSKGENLTVGDGVRILLPSLLLHAGHLRRAAAHQAEESNPQERLHPSRRRHLPRVMRATMTAAGTGK